MQDLIPFAFDDHLVRVVHRDYAPWFVGRDVCQCLGIRNENDALGSLDEDEREAGVGISDPSGTKYAIIISEPGVYRLVFRSRKPEAERFKRWLAHEVLPSLRRTGSYGTPAAPEPQREAPIIPLTYRERLDTVAEARMTSGCEAAKLVWARLGLPALPPPPLTLMDDAAACLGHLLGHTLPVQRSPGHTTHDSVRHLIEEAIDGDDAARACLMGIGVRVDDGREGFLVANRHLELEALYARTGWSSTSWSRVLRRLPGVDAAGMARFAKVQSRATFVPARWLDAGAL